MNETSIFPWYKNQIFHIMVLIFISSTILFPKIRTAPLSDWDEARYAKSAVEMVNSGNWITVTYNHEPDLANTKFPLGIWLTALNYKIFGVNEFSVRLWSVLFSIFTTILVYLLGSLIKNRWVGIWAALIFITSTQVVVGHAATSGDFDAGASFFFTLSLLLFLFAYKTRRNNYLFYGMAAVGLGTMYKSFMPGFLPLGIIFLFLLLSKEVKNYLNPKTILRCFLIIVAIITPWLVARSISDSSFLSVLLGVDYWDRLTSPAPGASYLFWFYAAQIKETFYPWVYFLPFGLFVTFKGYIQEKNKDYLFLVVWIFSVFLIFSIASTKNFWYILPAFPALALVTSLFWSTLLDKLLKLQPGRMWSVVTILFFVSTTILAMQSVEYYFNLRKSHNNFSVFIKQEFVKSELLSSSVIVHEYVATQSNVFYLDQILGDNFVSSPEFQCKLKSDQRWLLSSDGGFVELFLKQCPERKIVSSYAGSSVNSDLSYYLIK